ncbi:uncharacterized protein BO88DRAFT_408536 [Aspergillus vadensis CBS 113365]|uniref:Secreted protein n=1 Tax=Aspergillus vadensis (strain CBS 113365 / IMI 142717 / IBT 24658) TaxID=1448311 RepID=A0A319AXN1_ASPVC|nr:hypothetical protein BO88DRAFT_408536 [Aspergillus vadensis CBS 113365]PYH64374.1 hypothetical protein BO88DRAFT_408536 [Aspergillus vadensis CBS 113365]
MPISLGIFLQFLISGHSSSTSGVDLYPFGWWSRPAACGREGVMTLSCPVPAVPLLSSLPIGPGSGPISLNVTVYYGRKLNLRQLVTRQLVVVRAQHRINLWNV